MVMSFKEFLNEINLRHGNASHYSWKDSNGNLINLNFNYDEKNKILHVSANFNNDSSHKTLYNNEIDNDHRNTTKTMKYIIDKANKISDSQFHIGIKETIPMLGKALAIGYRDIPGAKGLPYRNRGWGMTFLEIDRS